MTSTNSKSLSRLRGKISGRNVFLRPFIASDISPRYIGWLNDPVVVRFSNQRFKTHTAESCRRYLDSFKGTENHFLCICASETDEKIGTLTVYHSKYHRTSDIGILLGDPTTWGKGYGLDAFDTVVKAIESSGDSRKVTAGTMALNTGMIRILQKAGLHHEATHFAQELIDDQPVDIVYYAKFLCE